MYFKSIHIESFGMLNDFDLNLSEGLNIIEGKNEAGKSTIASFIKFIFYGLSSKNDADGASEREKYISWKTGKAAGSVTIVTDREYVIEREVFSFGEQAAKLTEKLKIYDKATLEVLKTDKKQPGEIFFGMPEEIFVNTSYIGQLSDAKINAKDVSEAIENMLMSGDENINAEKALTKLDNVRKSLKLTRGQGGKIFELEREKARLEEKLADAKNKAADIIELETALFEIDGNIKSKEATLDSVAELINAYKKINAEKKLNEVRGYAAEIDRLDDMIADFDKYGNITDKEIEIQRLTALVNNIDDRLVTLRTKMSELDSSIPKMDEEDIKKARADVVEAEKCVKKKGSRLAGGIIFLLLMAGLIVANFFIPMITDIKIPMIPDADLMVHSACLGCAGIFAIIGALNIVGSVKCANKLKSILSTWEVDAPVKLEARIETVIRLSKTREDSASEYCATVSSLEKTKTERIETNAKLTEICTLFTEPDDDFELMSKNAIEASDKLAKELSDLKEKRQENYGKYSVLSYIIGDDGGSSIDKAYNEVIGTDIGRKASKLTEEEFAECEKLYGFAEATLPKLREQRSEKNTKLEKIRVIAEEPSAISAQLDAVISEYEDSVKKLSAIQLAADAIRKAQDNIRQTFLPRVSEQAGKMLYNFSCGKYDKLSLDNSFGVNYEKDGRVNNSALLSCGTKDIVYVSVRLSLLDVLFGDKVPPCIYDESFSRVDEVRLSSVIDILSAGYVTQSIIFTCRSLECDIARKSGNSNLIELK